MKRLVVCCDGTWNRPDQISGGKICSTNVAKIAQAIASRDAKGVLQHVYYHRGVGTNWWDHLRGGAFGVGLSENIRDAYGFLVKHFEPGDELWLFGFSRGAYTARSLAGFIRNSGMLRREHADRLEAGYALYRRRDADSNPRAIEAQLFRKTYSYESEGFEVRIRFIGVWDTVGALGIPVGVLGTLTRDVLHLQFHDVNLSSHVDNAFQALAIDERRPPFEPSVWRQQAHARGQRLAQAWFPGVHANVGGGYPDTGLSDIAFLWLKNRAADCGLAFDDSQLSRAPRPDPAGVLRNSRTGFYRLLADFVRPISVGGREATFEVVHPSAYLREERVRDYQPPNLPPKPLPSEAVKEEGGSAEKSARASLSAGEVSGG